MTKPGARIGAIQSANEQQVHLLGYGVYDGDFPYAPFQDDPSFTITTPRMTLDDGSVVWGPECWWGPEEKIRASIGQREVVRVKPVQVDFPEGEART